MSKLDFSYKSRISGMLWPAFPPLGCQDLLALLLQFEQSQWVNRNILQDQQLRQFGILAAYARQHSPFYQKHLAKAGFPQDGIWSMAQFRSLPLLTRSELQEHNTLLDCRIIPADHAPVSEIQSSGSTGQVVSVRRTAVNMLIWSALTLRDHFWNERDFRQSFAVIRAGVTAQDDEILARQTGWGMPAAQLFETGPMYLQPITLDLEQQARWLCERNPSYLLTYPTNLAALLDEFERIGRWPANLLEVRTIAEMLSPEIRQRCEKLTGWKIVDHYSTQEVGPVALQCPVSGLYHIQSESLLVEVLDEQGLPCSPGEIGRVVITDLHNFATPLIRYDIADYAEVGPPCSCGRGLPTITRIVGRQRNMMTFPGGKRQWPNGMFYHFRDIAPIRQFQLVQHSVHEIEVRLVVQTALDDIQQRRVAEGILAALGYPFELRFSYFDTPFPRTHGGKFEEFVSRLTP